MITVQLADEKIEMTAKQSNRYRTGGKYDQWYRHIRKSRWEYFDRVMEYDLTWTRLVYSSDRPQFSLKIATDYDGFRRCWREFRSFTVVLSDRLLAEKIRRYAYYQARGQLLDLVNGTLTESYHANDYPTKGRTLLLAIVLDKAKSYYDLANTLGEIVGVAINQFDRELTLGVLRFCAQLIAENTAPRYIYRRAQEFMHKVIGTCPEMKPRVDVGIITNMELYQANLHMIRLYLDTNVLSPVGTVWKKLDV